MLSGLDRRDKNSHIKHIYLHYEKPSHRIRFVSPFHVKRTRSLQWKDYLQSEQLANHPLNLCLEMFNAKRKSHIVYSRKILENVSSVFRMLLRTSARWNPGLFSFLLHGWQAPLFDSVQFTIVKQNFHNLLSLHGLKNEEVLRVFIFFTCNFNFAVQRPHSRASTLSWNGNKIYALLQSQDAQLTHRHLTENFLTLSKYLLEDAAF